MRWLVTHCLGFTLFVLAFPVPFVIGQENPSIVSIPFEIPSVPSVATPKTSEPPIESEISPNTGMARLVTPEVMKNYTITELAMLSSEYIDPRYIANSANPDRLGIWEKLRDGYGEQLHRLVRDYKNFYLSENLLYVGLAVGLAAPIANTPADQNLSTWYQRQAASSTGANNTALFFKGFGEYKYAIPGYLALSAAGNLFPEDLRCTILGEFGDRGWRALAVGAPMVGILQVGLGSDRPSAQDSHWHPFQSSHGVSGHAFVGAVPFLTAASMTDCQALQALLVVGSFAPSWSKN